MQDPRHAAALLSPAVPVTAPSPLRVLSIGEAMVELSPVDEGGLWRLGFAGDTLNTAWYLRRLLPPDQPVGYLTRLGRSRFSDALAAFIAQAGLVTDRITRDPDREVGLYAIHLDGGERSFSYWRDNSAARRLADDAGALAASLSGADWLYLSGITLAILPPAGRDTLLAALAAARTAGAQVALDPNLRPRLWADAATMRACVTRAAGLSDLVLPSLDDETAHFGDTGAEATVERYLGAGAGSVVVKAGGGPIRFGGAGGSGLVDDLAPEVPVDTTAAGDSFNAGFLAAWLGGQDSADAVRAGHAVSRQVIRRRGALVELA